MKTVTKKKVTLMLDSHVYAGLRARVGERGVGEFLSDLARPHVTPHSLEEGYRALAKDETHRQETREWLEGTEEPLSQENKWRF